MINNSAIVNGLPTLSTDEERIMERKDIRAEISISTKNYLEIGVLFLTTKRIIFITSEPHDMISFECLVTDIRDLSYSKKSDLRFLEGCVFGTDKDQFCRFKFSLAQTGLKSLVSILFSLWTQLVPKP